MKNATINQVVLKDAYINKFQNILELCSQNFNGVSKKSTSTQDCLLTMAENYKKALDQGNEYGSLLTDLSKVFDCLQHDVIVAKLHAYSFSIESLKLINSYLTERKQRVKGNDQFSSWLDIVVGVPQGLYWDRFCSLYFFEICFFFVMT